MQPAFAVGQILRGEFSVHSIDDCDDTLILGRQVLIEGAMHASWATRSKGSSPTVRAMCPCSVRPALRISAGLYRKLSLFHKNLS
ncbi:hypothetical protein D3C85_1077800 [compost metagenome]